MTAAWRGNAGLTVSCGAGNVEQAALITTSTFPSLLEHVRDFRLVNLMNSIYCIPSSIVNCIGVGVVESESHRHHFRKLAFSAHFRGGQGLRGVVDQS